MTAIPVVCLVGNEAAWAQIRRGQVEFFGAARAVATGLAYTRYDEVAKSDVVNVKIASSEFRNGASSV